MSFHLQLHCIYLVALIHAVRVIGYTTDEGALVTEKVFLKLEVEGKLVGNVVIGLFGSTSPKTVRNFVGLVNHEVSLWQTSSRRVFLCDFMLSCVEWVWL